VLVYLLRGITTYRDTSSSLWNKYDAEEVSTKEAWNKDREKVLDFFNMVHNSMQGHKPNRGHDILSELQLKHEVVIITQNVDDLHEKAGSNNVIHLHGEISLMRSSQNPKLKYPYKEISIGDKCENGSQLRPNVVLFEEQPENVEDAIHHIKNCDMFVVVGTSLSIGYTLSMLDKLDETKTSIFYVDPNPDDYLEGVSHHVEYFRKIASVGLEELFKDDL